MNRLFGYKIFSVADFKITWNEEYKMSERIQIIGPKALPRVLSRKEYDDYLGGFKRLRLEKLFEAAYRDKKNIGIYELQMPKVSEERNVLWDGYAAISKEKWRNVATVYIVAQFIYEHRIDCGRIGNKDDDFLKAEYLVGLVNYLNQKHSHIVRLRKDEEMEEIIDEVNNIFDSSYFIKMNNPHIPDSECFFQAEREYCEDKEIDFFVYQLRQDRNSAERSHEHKKIKALAEQYYKWRIEKGEPGDDKSDWVKAEEQYPTWKITKRIATICWNRSEDKHRHQDYYWSKACSVIRTLSEDGVNCVSMDPYEKCVQDIIEKVIKKEGRTSDELQESTSACA